MSRKQNKKKTKSPAKVVQEAEVVAPKSPASAAQIIKKFVDESKEDAAGYMVCIGDKSGKILPFVSAGSVGDLLTMKYVLEKEIARILDKVSNPQPVNESH